MSDGKIAAFLVGGEKGAISGGASLHAVQACAETGWSIKLAFQVQGDFPGI
jgi:geranylgeranyl pyrophosphate synthase